MQSRLTPNKTDSRSGNLNAAQSTDLGAIFCFSGDIVDSVILGSAAKKKNLARLQIVGEMEEENGIFLHSILLGPRIVLVSNNSCS